MVVVVAVSVGLPVVLGATVAAAAAPLGVVSQRVKVGRVDAAVSVVSTGMVVVVRSDNAGLGLTLVVDHLPAGLDAPALGPHVVVVVAVVVGMVLLVMVVTMMGMEVVGGRTGVAEC